jgi:hypothetical protein
VAGHVVAVRNHLGWGIGWWNRNCWALRSRSISRSVQSFFAQEHAGRPYERLRQGDGLGSQKWSDRRLDGGDLGDVFGLAAGLCVRVLRRGMVEGQQVAEGFHGAVRCAAR